MPLNDKYPLAVTFIIAARPHKDGSVVREPIGTGFIVNVPTRYEDTSFEYVFTASHVVCNDAETHVRIRTRDGGSKDLRVPEWVHHPNADVAAAPFDASGHDDLHLLNVPAASSVWRDIPDWAPDLGERVYFIGLLSLPAARVITARNVPMVRSGTVGALYQGDVPHKWPDGTIRRFETHLIDCRSYGGFSGSPCFFQDDDGFRGVKDGVEQRGPVTWLLGLVSGHFDLEEVEEDSADFDPHARPARVNTGVGLIAPVERIVEVLEMPEFADERERVTQERKEREESEGATLDSVESESEFERFERLARELVNTPKTEVDEKRKGDS